jgi:hypothetical protein
MNTIKLFNKALVTKNMLPFNEVNNLAMSIGYVIHPDVCNKEVYQWLKTQDVNYNSTFYKNWNDVTSKTRFELLIDQLFHYASTYGTNFEGEAYIPEGEVVLPPMKNYKLIGPISKDETIVRCENMLFSGIALKQDTIEDILSLFDELGHDVLIENVKNKEAKMFLYQKTGKLPFDPIEMVRYLVFLNTEKTLLIKNRENIFQIKHRPNFNLTSYVEKFGYEKLSSVFYRFKPLFLAFRNSDENKECVNKLRRLAVKNHAPSKNGFFETLLSEKKDISEILLHLDSLNNYKKIKLLQAINVRKKQLSNRAFVVRNQKIFIKEGVVKIDVEYLDLVYALLYKSLCEAISTKACKVKLHKGVNITLPTSEKSFIGNYPLGSSFDFSDSDNIVGIYWRGEDGANDLDLSLIDINGVKYGWNSHYTNSNNSIIFSGDMVQANPEATELYYTSKGFNPSIVKVNLYNGQPNSKFKFFLAKEKYAIGKKGYMVNPDNILVNVDMEMDSKEKILGVITENKFILAEFRSGKGRVSTSSVTDLYRDIALETLDCYISMEKLLLDSGFEFVNENADIDLTNLSKDTLINLLN